MRKWIESKSCKSDLIAGMTRAAMAFENAVLLCDGLRSSESYYGKLSRYEAIAAFDNLEAIQGPLSGLSRALTDDWYLGWLCYELKDEIFGIGEKLPDSLVGFPTLHFFRPRWILILDGERIRLGYDPRYNSEDEARSFLTSVTEWQRMGAEGNETEPLQATSGNIREDSFRPSHPYSAEQSDVNREQIKTDISGRQTICGDYSEADKASEVVRLKGGPKYKECESSYIGYQEVSQDAPLKGIALEPAISREDYIEDVKGLQEHIHRGDIYEVNYCMEFNARGHIADPAALFVRLVERSHMPFAAFIKFGRKYALSASPERFITKRGNKLYSMPMKGTAPRGYTPAETEANRRQLQESEKERAENIMITDLVRNDLSVVATKGSVMVEELCGIYSFPSILQSVSTISAEISGNTTLEAILRATFPMGSMTGAPKISAMQLISEFEKRKRGLFSGSIGYISPDGDFDLNVVIRTLLYDEDSAFLSYTAGSAITALSDAEQEYEECLLKAKLMRSLLAETR